MKTKLEATLVAVAGALALGGAIFTSGCYDPAEEEPYEEPGLYEEDVGLYEGRQPLEEEPLEEEPFVEPGAESF